MIPLELWLKVATEGCEREHVHSAGLSTGYLAKPHVHERVPGLADLPHVQLPGSGGHAAWVGGVQPAQLVGREYATLMDTGEE